MLVIFDWDGTLSDSEGKIIQCMQAAADSLSFTPLTDHSVREIIGLGLPEAIKVLYPGIDPAGVVALRDGYSKHFIEADQQPSAFFPTAMDTLEALRESGHQIAVATGKSRRGLDRVLTNLGLAGYFHATRCADETASKPHPKMLFELMQELQVEGGSAVMVGDTSYDMEMAQRADMPRIAVSYGAHTVERLASFEPELCVDQLSDMLDWVQREAATA